MENLSLNSDSLLTQVRTNLIGTQSLTDEPKQAPSVNTPDPRFQSAPPAEAKVLLMGKHLSTDSKQPSGKPPPGKPPSSKSQPTGYANVKGKGSFGASAATGKPKGQKVARRAGPATARPSFAAKATEADGWVSHDDSNTPGYDTEQLRMKLFPAVRTTSSQDIKLRFESVGG